MKIVYLDVSCLNRPFDDQQQPRIRLEAEAVALVLQGADAGFYGLVSSQMAEIEIAANPDVERRNRVTALLPVPSDIMKLTPAVFRRAEALAKMGFKPADAVHVAAAEALKVDAMLSCDDRLRRLAARSWSRLAVRVANPLEWIKENPYAPDA